MIFDLPQEQSSIIKVIGVGGGGSNAVNYMYSQGIRGVNFVICNTDAQAMELSPIPNKIQLGPFLTEGLGAGADPEVGRRAAEESIEDIKKILEKNTKMVFITAGMGGGTGTGGAPVVAKIAKEMGILTVGIVTRPFRFEGNKRLKNAEEGIKAIRDHVDSLIIISNDRVLDIYKNLKRSEAFGKANDILTTAAKSTSEIITYPGEINVDFADVQSVMRNGGVALMGHAVAGGENRAKRAVEEALSSPLLNDNNIFGAKKVLINIIAGKGEFELGMSEIEDITTHVQKSVGDDADVFFGTSDDESLGENISVTLIATGFEHVVQNDVIQPPAKILNKTTSEITPAVTPTPEKVVVDLESTAAEKTATDLLTAQEALELNETALESVNEEQENLKAIDEDFFNAQVNEEQSEEKTDNVVEFEVDSSFSVEESVQFVENDLNQPTDLFSQFQKTVKEGENHQPAEESGVNNTMQNNTTERMKHFSNLSMKLNNPGNLNEIEQEPAYKRKAITLSNNPHSSQTNMSKFTYTPDNDNESGEIRRNNSFLHDNVD
jgi:cell division protein FtsZ